MILLSVYIQFCSNCEYVNLFLGFLFYLFGLYVCFYVCIILFWLLLICNMGFLCGSAGKESFTMQETWVQFLSWQVPLEKGKSTHSSILAWKITVHGVTKSQTWLSEWLEYYATFKKKEILPFVTIWRTLELTVLSKLDTERQMLFWCQRLSKASKSNEVITLHVLG